MPHPGDFDTTLTKEEAARIPDGFLLSVRVTEENGGWTALAMPFDIAGTGSTVRDALADMLALVEDYLSVGFAEGADFQDLIRPAPRRYRLTMAAAAALHVLMAGRDRPHVRRGPRRQRYLQELPLKEPAGAC